jgi:hypothetical protein
MRCEYLREEDDESMSIKISWKEENVKDKDFLDKRMMNWFERKSKFVKYFYLFVFEFLSKGEKIEIFDSN